jgi:ribosomal protein S18 acetylase RimI-like enzyme
MEIRRITPDLTERTALLAAECYAEDPFFRTVAATEENRRTILALLFERAVTLSARCGMAYCCVEEGRPVAFALWMDGRRATECLTDPAATFRGRTERLDTLCQGVRHLLAERPHAIHLMALGVSERYRGGGLATLLAGLLTEGHPARTLTAAVTNLRTLRFLERIGFCVTGYRDGCALCLLDAET